jgi:hypothetical protein
MELTGQGITTTLPPGWEGRITRRVDPTLDRQAAAAGFGTPGERTYPVAHLANFALPENRADFGSGAVDVMGPDHLFVCLFEYGPESVGTALFAPQGLPRKLRPGQFSPRALQHVIPGQSGCQRFFTEGNRAFCLFVVLGSHDNAPALVPLGNQVLSATTIEAR